MSNKAKSCLPILMLVLISVPLLAPAADVSLEGVVNDPGVNPANSGVPGVWITVRNAKNKEVGSGLTDGRGGYKIKLPRSDITVTAFYEKLGYQPRPAVRSITDLKKKQDPVLLVREEASSEYYKEFAKSIVSGAAQLSQPERNERVHLVVSLSQSVKSRVTEQLKELPAAAFLGEIQTAEKIDAMVKTKLDADPDVKGYIIVETGEKIVKLNGFVETSAEKVRAGELAKSVAGVEYVENYLRVLGIRSDLDERAYDFPVGRSSRF
jgi:hypothetical protein